MTLSTSVATPLRLAAVAAAVLLTTTACSSSEGDDVARDPAPDAPTGAPALDLPADVRSRGLVMVMDTGDGPQVCLGAIAESWPPQCGGPEVLGWDWSEHEIHEKQGRVRWGSFAVTGSWDGTALTVADAIPAALYDVMREEPEPDPLPTDPPSAAELEAIAEEVAAELPGVSGAQGAYPTEQQVYVDVPFDDGTLQQWADTTYGEHVVVVVPALLPRQA